MPFNSHTVVVEDTEGADNLVVGAVGKDLDHGGDTPRAQTQGLVAKPSHADGVDGVSG
jgi:hypothetical protein